MQRYSVVWTQDVFQTYDHDGYNANWSDHVEYNVLGEFKYLDESNSFHTSNNRRILIDWSYV